MLRSMCNNFRKWKSSYRVFIVFLSVLVFTFSREDYLRQYAQDVGLAVTPYFFAFQMDDGITRMLFYWLVGLDPEDKKKVGKFSLGMRQRLGIAQAIMESPDILILDEPMNGLDKHGVEDMRKLLVQLKEEGTTILVASHNPLDIEILCDEVYEMDAGAITKVH